MRKEKGKGEVENNSKRCVLDAMVLVGSYQATLKRIGLHGIDCEGFPFGSFDYQSIDFPLF